MDSRGSPLHRNSCPSTGVETSFRTYLKRLSRCLNPKPLRGLPFQFSIFITDISSTGILTCCPSHTLFSLYLGPTNPWLTDIAMETLDIRRAGFSPALRYSSQHSHFYTLQQLLTGHLHSDVSTAKSIMYRTLPYHSHILKGYTNPQLRNILSAPLHFKCRISRLVSFYALFKGWLPLSQPPNCLRNSTSFPTKV